MTAGAAHIEWKLQALLRSADVGDGFSAGSCSPDAAIKRLTVDSRDAVEGSCFVALEGSRVDGHRFVRQALDLGASAVVVEAGRVADCSDRIIEVSNSHEAVARLAATFYGVDRLQREGKLKLIAVTGTNGKTTVITLLTSILRAAGYPACSLGTIGLDLHNPGANSVATTVGMTTPPPIELCSMLAGAVRAGAKYVAMEVSSHALDQRRCDGLDFEVGVFTNLTQDHLDYHGNMDRYALAKRRLFDGLNQNAVAVVNADDSVSPFMTAQTSAGVVSFSIGSARGDVFAENLKLRADGTVFDLNAQGDQTVVNSPLIGLHNVSNTLAAIAAARSLGVDLKAICAGIVAASLIPGRLERVPTSASCDVFVDYAHTPDALENVLCVLRGLTRGRLICVFGCGGDRDKTKRAPMGRAVAGLADVGILTSDNPRHEDRAAIIEDVLIGFDGKSDCKRIVQPDRRDAIFEAIGCAGEQDTVLIAGKGHEDYQLIGDERRPFDDRLVAQEAAKQILEVTA